MRRVCMIPGKEVSEHQRQIDEERYEEKLGCPSAR